MTPGTLSFAAAKLREFRDVIEFDDATESGEWAEELADNLAAVLRELAIDTGDADLLAALPPEDRTGT